jgi:hypothetical protein
VLLVLAGRDDLLQALEPQRVLTALLRPWPAPEARAACARALRTLPPGPLREALCRRAMDPDREPAAIAAVTSGDLRPADPHEVAFFLLATEQWMRLTQTDPKGRQLYGYCRTIGFARPALAQRTVEVLLRLDGRAPAMVRTVAEVALRDAAPGPAREHLCVLARRGDPDAARIVVAAGHRPQASRDVPAFLFLTGQLEQYDAADPRGSRLRAQAAKLPPGDRERDLLRAAARRAGRPAPCDAARSPDESARYRPGGTGVGGTGGFTVHGV